MLLPPALWTFPNRRPAPPAGRTPRTRASLPAGGVSQAITPDPGDGPRILGNRFVVGGATPEDAPAAGPRLVAGVFLVECGSGEGPQPAPPPARQRLAAESPSAFCIAGVAVPYGRLTVCPVEPVGTLEMVAYGAFGEGRCPLVIDHDRRAEASPAVFCHYRPSACGLIFLSDPLPANDDGQALVQLFKSKSVRGVSLSHAVRPDQRRPAVAGDGSPCSVIEAGHVFHIALVCAKVPAYPNTMAWLTPA